MTFPSRIAFSPFSPGIVSARLQLGMPASEARPGSNSELSIYEPAGSRRARSLPCVLISPGGGTLLCGPKPAKGDDADWLEYARAGMAVVVFHVDGEIDIRQSSAFEVAEASARFFAAQAGLVNARNALEFVLARMPEVDPRRIYVAGQGSAATLALLFAEHEPRVAACIACCAVVDAAARFERLTPELAEKAPAQLLAALERTSPGRHVAKLGCPLYLVEADSESKATLDEFRAFVDRLQAEGKRATVGVRAAGGSSAMLATATAAAIHWLKSDRRSPSEDRRLPTDEPVATHEPVASPAPSAAPVPSALPEDAALEQRLSHWVASATTLASDLAKIVNAGSLESAAVARLDTAAASLASQTHQLSPPVAGRPGRGHSQCACGGLAGESCRAAARAGCPSRATRPVGVERVQAREISRRTR